MSVSVRRALFFELSEDPTLIGFLGGTAIYHQVAPPEAEYPFLVFHKQSGNPRYALKSSLAFDNELWTIKVIDRNTTSDTADDIADRVDEFLTDGTLDITGRTLMGVWRESDIEFIETVNDQQYRHVGAMFRLIYE